VVAYVPLLLPIIISFASPGCPPCLQYAADVADGMAYLHANRIIHGDLKVGGPWAQALHTCVGQHGTKAVSVGWEWLMNRSLSRVSHALCHTYM
jgi:hypothetical protein